MSAKNLQKFDELYKKLNSEQRSAVDTIDGPVIVIAGPGTGKTSILTLRIANILQKTDTAPENVLALTFTESGVHSIRKKLVETIGTTGYRIPIHTFHSFCNDVIKSFPQEFPRIIGAQHVTDVDQIGILENLILNGKLDALRPVGNPLYYLKAILGFIKELKREDVGPAEYRKHVKNFEKGLEDIEDLRHEKGAYKGEIKSKYKPALRKIENSAEFAELYEKYQAALEEKRLYDYEDMIIEVLRELRENKSLLLELQETYQYILADEHQDANRGQNRLLELLSGFHEQPNLFVVGDEKQAIFRFQGASLENFLYFKKRFPDAVLISLNKNYRSTQGILDASHSLIEKNPTGYERVRLESKNNVEKTDVLVPIYVTECNSVQSEADAVAEKITEKIKAGALAEQVAVLFRDNRDAELISRAFDDRGVPYVLHTDIDVISNEHIQKLIHVLRAVNHFGDEKLLTPVLFIDFFGLNHLDVFKLFKRSRESRRSLVEIMRSEGEMVPAGIEEPQKFHELFELLHELSISAKNRSLIDSLQETVSRVGFIGYLLGKPRAMELVSAYDALLSHTVELLERQKNVKLADYLSLLDTMNVHGISVRAKSVSSYPGKVNLMTAHRSKGLEFDYVFCMNLNDGKWGGRRSPSHFLPITAQAPDELENDVSDERRLLYVALTRARKEIGITYSTHSSSGREILPSRFLEEIDRQLLQFEKRESGSRSVLPIAPVGPDNQLSVKNREYIAELFLEHGFSVSALNNYLSCPWRFFFLNLIRIPQAEDRFQLYGTSVHETLKIFFDAYKDNKALTKKETLQFFENFLNRKSLSGHDYEMFLKKGRESIGGYLDHYKNTWSKNILNEFKVTGAHIPFQKPDGSEGQILLRGQLDKVEIEDGSSVNVVDYKTGNPKSRREIEGETKSSDGNYKRQLVFYKLLLETFDPDRFTMRTGEIDFVEPNKQGKYKSEKFEVTDIEVSELVSVIKKAAGEILSLSFWNQKCDDAECDFCKMRDLLGE
jgi:DNA helicase-2/ATP-dependent DNA helicase PcrA